MISGNFEAVLLFGSPSVERRVSVASAQHMAACFQSRLWFWTQDDSVVEVTREELLSHEQAFTQDFLPSGTRSFETLEAALDGLAADRTVVLIGAHGGAGEDGRLQRMLEDRGLAFTGSGSRASALAFDKSKAVGIASGAGLRVPKAVVLPADRATAADEAIAEAYDVLGPMVVKAQEGGSSLQLCFVEGVPDLDAAAALLRSEPGMTFRAEAIVRGREFTVGVIKRAASLEALPCSEVVMQPGRSFDYEGKYLGAGSQEITPARIPDALTATLQREAMQIHRALGCSGYSRNDFIVDDKGPVFLETNTLPGLTRQSFIPQQLEAASIPFTAFLDEQIALALARRDQG